MSEILNFNHFVGAASQMMVATKRLACRHRCQVGNRRRVIGLAVLLLSLACQSGSGEEIDFDRHIAPILSGHCLACHGSTKSEGGLDLSQSLTTRRGGESGAAVVAGSLDLSVLWDRVNSGEMPPTDSLSKGEKAAISNWIRQGAIWGSDPIDPFRFSSDKRAGYDWWSLLPLPANSAKLLPTALDKTAGDWSRNEIDRFVFAKLDAVDLKPSPRAEPTVLVRRLYFDLIGLPPPYEVVERFCRDPSQAAWAELVDNLLQSQHYGERWAQHWLDVARFGESDGYEYNVPREYAWPYRDWVIRAFNDDMPYDEFVRMQIAGDLLRPHSVEGAAAVGFLVAGVHNTVLGKSDAMKLAARHEELEEIVGTTAQAFLGLTVNCARCHDHKFDPISNREYYQLISALDGVSHGTRNVAADFTPKELSDLQSRRDLLLGQLHTSVTERGGKISSSANAIQLVTGVAANDARKKYTVRFLASPTVWADKSQATTSGDGLLLRILKTDGTVLFEKFVQPKPWGESGNKQNFTPFHVEYIGDGGGDVRLWIGSNPATGRFGGAIDDLRIEDSTGEKLFEERFDDFEEQTNKGTQADTGLTLFWGLQSKRWERFGINSLHGVENSPGNIAAQIFSGWPDVDVRAETDQERKIQGELATIKQRLLRQPVYSVTGGSPGVMRILERGDPKSLGDEVAPAGLRAIVGVSPEFGLAKDAADEFRRIKLAEWMTHRDNGPFHRVIVNRIWHHHFGTGIVETPNDLGFNGGRPSHPELLDWLAVWFRSHGYSIKDLHRHILTSATYQQKSAIADHSHAREAQHIDRGNRLLWRQNPRRLDAETVRDSLITCAGRLDRRPFGPGYQDVKIERVGSAHYYIAVDAVGELRRTVYRRRFRGERSSLLESFDCPDPSATTPNRNVTTTPTQLLSQWNHALVIAMSKEMAAQLGQETAEPAKLVVLAWQRVLSREPAEDELQTAIRLVEEHGAALLCRVLFNCSEAIVID